MSSWASLRPRSSSAVFAASRPGDEPLVDGQALAVALVRDRRPARARSARSARADACPSAGARPGRADRAIVGLGEPAFEQGQLRADRVDPAARRGRGGRRACAPAGCRAAAPPPGSACPPYSRRSASRPARRRRAGRRATIRAATTNRPPMPIGPTTRPKAMVAAISTPIAMPILPSLPRDRAMRRANSCARCASRAARRAVDPAHHLVEAGDRLVDAAGVRLMALRPPQPSSAVSGEFAVAPASRFCSTPSARAI